MASSNRSRSGRSSKVSWPRTSKTWPPRALRSSSSFSSSRMIDLAFARILGHEIPQVADFGLADAVDTAEALLQAVRIPGQVVVDHQVGALQVDAFAGGVGGDEDFDFLVVRECLLGLAPFLAADAAVNDDDGLGPSDECPDPLGEIIQRVAMLGEDDELAAMPVGVEHLRVVLQEPGQLIPLAIGSGLPYTQSDVAPGLVAGRFRAAAPRWCGRQMPDRRRVLRSPRPRHREHRRDRRGHRP